MAEGPRPAAAPYRRRGSGTELWLLRAGPPVELEARLRAFQGTALARVLCAPGGSEEEWAEAIARAHSAPLAREADLGDTRPGEPEEDVAARAWAALEQALETGAARVLAVLPPAVLRAAVAQALGFPLERAVALRVDPGRAVLLRDDPVGIVLRRSNALAPETSSGTPLPGGTADGER